MSTRALSSTKSRLLVYTAAPLLVVYLILLLTTTYYSQQQLHQAAQQSLRSELQKRAAALSYFYSERRADISRLAQERALLVFFSNRALGMSMEYGLRTSLLGMQSLAETMVSTRKLERSPIYKRIVIEDAQGEILVDEGTDAGQPHFWTASALTAPTTPQLRVSTGTLPIIYLVAPVINRATPVAIIIAQIDHRTVINHLIRHQDEADNYVINLAHPLLAETADPPTADQTPTEQRQRQTEPIPDTPFELAFVGDTRRIGGILASGGYFLALAFLALALLLLLGFMAWQIQERERALIASRDELAEANGQLRKSQKRLVQSEKMASLGTLAAGVAHEINNPIGFIQANLVNLRDYQSVLIPLVKDYHALVQSRAESEPDLLQRWQERLLGEDLEFLLEDLDSLLSDTTEGSRRVAEIVAGLRSFAHGGELRDEPIDINDCVAAALSLATNELKYKAEVEQRLGELPSIRGHSGQITQVLVNLLVNAAQAIEAQGQVSIETRHEGGSILIRVRDTGRGISPEHMDQLFTPFFTTKDIGAGTGLGLSISQGIVESHGGSIHAESELGRGTLFTVTLPVDGPDAQITNDESA